MSLARLIHHGTDQQSLLGQVHLSQEDQSSVAFNLKRVAPGRIEWPHLDLEAEFSQQASER